MHADTNGHQDADIADLIAVRQPGWSLAQPFYTDPAILDLDMARIFRRYWLFVGHSVQIPKPGDYFLYEIGGDSIIVIRGDDGQARALHNTCRHRGSLVCLEPSGHVKKFVCPYHQWVYERDGALASARFMPEDFDRSGFGLHRAHLREVEGLLFISLADDPPDFDPVERDYRPYLKPYGLTRAKICHTARYDLKTNWKLITENFRECYHCGGGHPEYCRAVIGASMRDSPEEIQAVWEDRRRHWQRLGLPTEPVRFTPDIWHHVSRYPFRPGWVSESLDGQPVAPLLGDLTDRDAGVFAIVQYPNFWLEASSDYCWTMRTTPLEPTRTRVDLAWLVREDAVEGVDYEVERVVAFWKATGEQDWQLCENNQAGVNSSRYQPGPYAPCESGVETFLLWYLRQLAEGSCRR